MTGAGPLRVVVIASRSQLRWRSLRFLIDGLSGPLGLAGLFAGPAGRGDGGKWVPALAAAERAVFAAGQAGAAAEVQVLPAGPAELPACDVIVDFRAGPVPAALAARAEFGVWQCSCHDTGIVAAAVMGGASALECRVLCQAGPSPVLRLLAGAVVQTKVTIAHSQVFASEKSVQMILRELRRLALTGILPDHGLVPNGAAYPGLAQLPGYAGRVAGRAARKLRARILAPEPQPFALRTGKGDLLQLDPGEGTDIPLPGNTFCADPFLIQRGGEVYCFYEAFPYSRRRGHIAAARLTADGAEELGPALAADYHLSFPFLFESGGDLFMLPETIQAERIEIWRCVAFPLKWQLHATALEGVRLGDPVLFQQGDAWWLFANSCHDSFGDFSSELSLFRTDGPGLTQIEPHPLNPVVVGSDTARSGGQVFTRDGRLYRLSQDNSGAVYGYGLNLMEITELSETAYSEQRVAHYTPDRIPGAIGLHHAPIPSSSSAGAGRSSRKSR